MPHILSDHPLPGIDPRRLKRLSAAGLESLEDVVSAGPERLAEVTGFDAKTCKALIRVAEVALSQQDLAAPEVDGVIEFTPAHDEPSSMRLARGLKSARLIERALSLVRKARSHTGRRPPRDGWAKPHRRARKQLRKLLDRLETLQQSVLSEGLSQQSHDHLTGELEAFETALQPFLDHTVHRRTLKRIRRLAQTTRHALEASSPR